MGPAGAGLWVGGGRERLPGLLARTTRLLRSSTAPTQVRRQTKAAQRLVQTAAGWQFV
jgi:hypothetical protein